LVWQCAFTARFMQYFKLVQEKNFWDQHPFLHTCVWHHSWRTITLLVLYYTTLSTIWEVHLTLPYTNCCINSRQTISIPTIFQSPFWWCYCPRSWTCNCLHTQVLMLAYLYNSCS
jgi:hypothetical protein